MLINMSKVNNYLTVQIIKDMSSSSGKNKVFSCLLIDAFSASRSTEPCLETFVTHCTSYTVRSADERKLASLHSKERSGLT